MYTQNITSLSVLVGTTVVSLINCFTCAFNKDLKFFNIYVRLNSMVSSKQRAYLLLNQTEVYYFTVYLFNM